MSLAQTFAGLLPDFIDAVADAVAKRLQAPPPDYDSRINLPPGVKPRSFRTRCAQIPEATREGKVWRCPRAAWHASFPQADRTADAGHDAYEQAIRGAR